MSKRPTIFVIGGPNGAGKTTIARAVLAQTLGIWEFVNADSIAAGLSGFAPNGAAIAAGRVMLLRLRELAVQQPRNNFAFETTMASRSFAPWLSELLADGWEMHLLYVWLRSPELAVHRVQSRVQRGGHHIPEEDIRRRYVRSAANFWHLYLPLATSWQVYDNSDLAPQLLAWAPRHGQPVIVSQQGFDEFRESTSV